VNLRRTRLAPSPTGALHLGNATTFLINWAIARANDWEIIMRIEDLNGPRIHAGSIAETIDILQWLGIDWDGDVYIQSEELVNSQRALAQLIGIDAVYHCNLSRTEIEEATFAPHREDEQKQKAIRPDHVRSHNMRVDNEDTNWRFIVPDSHRTVHDQFYGSVQCELDQDFIVWTKQGTPSYQLAVVVDDHRQGITDVIRGNDLLKSAAWQELLYNAFDWEPPTWHHLPLILGSDGKRLAKRHGDTRISSYRRQGVNPERIIALIARWCNIQGERIEMNANTFCQQLDSTKMQTADIVFTNEDEQWLLD